MPLWFTEDYKMHQKTKYLALSAVCTALMAVGAYIRFPLPFLTVQFTTQVFFLLVTALILPPAYSTGALAAYVLLGLIGFPVFSSGGGLQTVLTPNFGYLLGFVFSSFVTSFMKQKWRGRFPYLFPAMIGALAVYMVALPYVALLSSLYQSKPVAFYALMSGYFLAFLPLDLIKAAGAAVIARQVRKAVRI
jgi:biotin transport system substrate-specific component